MLVKNERVSIKTDDIEIESSHCKKLLGTKIDSKLSFKGHLNGVIKKIRQKVDAFSRFTPYMNIANRRLLMNSFFKSQFNYHLLIRIFDSRGLNNKRLKMFTYCI